MQIQDTKITHERGNRSMPLYMDIHEHVEGLTAEAVAGAHAQRPGDPGEVRREIPELLVRCRHWQSLLPE